MTSQEKEYEDSLLRSWDSPPWIILKVLTALVTFLNSVINKLTPPAVRAIFEGTAFISSSWFMMMAHLGVPECLKNGPKSAEEIATELGGLRQDDLYRALRMLVSRGYFEAIPGKNGQPTRFRNNAASAVLRGDHPASVKSLTSHWHRHAYSSFSQPLLEWHLKQSSDKEPLSCFEKERGEDFWSFLRKDPREDKLFSRAMDDVNNAGMEALIADFHWGKFSRIIDIGGANGSVSIKVLEANPSMQGVLFDQPAVIKSASEIWQQRSDLSLIRKRVNFVAGDFFKPETIPVARDGDLYFMRSILHDWNDECSTKILQSLREAIGTAKATVALAELTLEPEFSNSMMLRPRFVIDMLMLSLLRGKERTLEQWKQLFASSKFALKTVVETRSPMIVIEAIPI